MAIFTGPMCQHVDGKKELTAHESVVTVQASSKVYIPLIHMNSTKFEVHVNEGDHVKIGTKLATRNDNFIVPVFSSVSGTVGKIVNIMHPSLRVQPHLEIISDGLNEEEPSFDPISPHSSREELITFMKDAGIVGCGGAGFPAYIKYQGAKDIHTVVINGVECEPYITADAVMMEKYTKELVIGASTMVKMAMAKEAVIAIKSTKVELIKHVREALQGVENVRVAEVRDVYPMGWERTVVFELFKKRYDRLPGEIGVIVSNATTAISFAQAMLEGHGITHKMVTVSGDAIKPANVWVPVGMQVKEIVEKLGGYLAEDVLLIAGGPMMGKTVINDQFVISSYSNAITILKTTPIDSVACLRCGSCTDHCPAGIQPVRIRQLEKAGDIDGLKTMDVMSCIECGLCTYVCPSKLDVTESVRRAKRRIQLLK
ncbi:MAG: RnfABCDGE type electron transport complex subunit C [Erysipelotrichaceae bacterium]|nr:RnfABCDGE type electron transport complex subunit C [Erysipelotrichaceae bacterium]